MAYKGSDESIPRIGVQEENGQIVCIIDSLTAKRYGPVLTANKKQGLHFFSVGYCLTSMAARFCKPSAEYREILFDIAKIFHPNFMTKVLINAKSKMKHTFFSVHWDDYLEQMLVAYQSLLSKQNSRQKSDISLYDLEEYLNFAGAIQHVLPCNVAHSENASDPMGGQKAKQAIQRFYGLASKGISQREKQIESNISDIIDSEVVEAFFKNGFDANSVWYLAFICLQIDELRPVGGGLFGNTDVLHYNQVNNMREYVYKLLDEKYPLATYKSQYLQAFHDAMLQLRDTRREVNSLLRRGAHGEFLARVAREMR